MTIITPTPYADIIGKNDNVVQIQVRAQDFQNVVYQEGKTAISFLDCYFGKMTIENTEVIDFKDISIFFSNCYLADIDSLDQILSINISLYFHNCIIGGRIKSESIQTIYFNNCLLRSGFFVTGVQKVVIAFTGENLHLERWIAKYRGMGKVGLRNILTWKQSYYFYSCKEIRITSNLNKKRRPQFSLNLAVFYKEGGDEKTLISNVQLDSLSMQGEASGHIEVESCQVNRLFLYDFTPRQEAQFYDIEPVLRGNDVKMGIHKCNLDNAWFDSIRFNKYPIVSFYRTKLSKTTFVACHFSEDISAYNFIAVANVHYPGHRTVNDPRDLYEIILQLKKAVETTGNYYEAQKLQAVAHEALRKIPSIPREDRIVLAINRGSNNHGLQVKRAFCWLLACSIAFYLLYLFSLHRLFTSASIDLNLIGYYFSFLDLTHRSDFLVDTKAELNGWALTIDYFNKVVVGFLTFQLISAFRKYVKK